MRRINLMLAFAIAWGMQAGVASAENDWWDHLSGPGGFRGFFVTYRYLCLSNTSDDPGVQRNMPVVRHTWLSPVARTASFLALRRKAPTSTELQDTSNGAERQARLDCTSDQHVRGYLFATYRHAVSIRNALVVTAEPDDNQVHVDGVDFGYVDRVSPSFDISLGFGYNHFWGAAFNSFDRPSVTPLIEFSPLANALEGPRAHIIKIMVGGTLWFKQFRAQQFCNKPNATCLDPTWRSGPEFTPRIGFLFDLSVLRR